MPHTARVPSMMEAPLKRSSHISAQSWDPARSLGSRAFVATAGPRSARTDQGTTSRRYCTTGAYGDIGNAVGNLVQHCAVCKPSYEDLVYMVLDSSRLRTLRYLRFIRQSVCRLSVQA